MKVLLLAERMGVGGMETHIESLARGLARLGVDVTVLSAGGETAERLAADGIRQIHLPLTTRNPIKALLLRRRLRELVRREHYDILHAHARFPALLMRGMERRYGCREIVTMHAKFAMSPLLRRICHWGSYTITVSEDLRRHLIDSGGGGAEQIRVIANGIDLHRFSPPPCHSEQTETHILFSSRLDEDCALGAELLCRLAPTLAQAYPRARIGILGGGRAKERIRVLAEHANQLSGCEMVTLYGSCTDPLPLLQKTDIFVGVSRAAMEAAACGAAVILCGNEGYLGILSPENETLARLTNFCARGHALPTQETLQKDLFSLLEDAKTRIRAASFANSLIRRHGSEEEMCRLTLSLYHRARQSEKRATLAVGGYFGCGNLGDDAILQGVLQGLSDLSPGIRVICLSGNARRDRKRLGVHAVGRKNPFAVASALRRADLFLCGGGSLLQNATGNRSLLYYLSLLGLSHLLGTKPILFAAGIGPLYGDGMQKAVRSTLALCPYISLREPDSKELLESLDLDPAHLHLGADPAFLLPAPPPLRAPALLAAHGIAPSTPYLCIVLKGGRMQEDVRRLVLAAARVLCRRHTLLPILLTFDTKKDKKATRIAQKTLHGCKIHLSEAADAAAILAGATATLTMRLHALILATAARTPAVGIPSDPDDGKIASFARLAAQDHVPYDRLTVAAIVEAAEAAIEMREARRAIWGDVASDLRKKAQKDLANIVTMLYNKKQNATKSEDIP